MTAARAYTPWGGQPLTGDESCWQSAAPIRLKPDNDNTPTLRPRTWPPMIGLTGLRNVGKSTVANLLEEEFGFNKIHAFSAGKEAAERWFDTIGGDGHRMVYGDLKDEPSEHLPGGVAPRYFLEKFGHFMGAEMGVAWTLGLEISLARKRNPRAPIVVESLVYEAGWFRRQGGLVVRLERPGHVGPVGCESDAVQAQVAADETISAQSVEELRGLARKMAQQVMGGG